MTDNAERLTRASRWWKRGATERLKDEHLKRLSPIADSAAAVRLLDAGYGQCRAIIAYESDLIEKAVCCGEATVTRLNGQPSSWCRYHHSKYTEPSRPKAVKPIAYQFRQPTVRKRLTAASSVAA
jgi:hypothetical protein